MPVVDIELQHVAVLLLQKLSQAVWEAYHNMRRWREGTFRPFIIHPQCSSAFRAMTVLLVPPLCAPLAVIKSYHPPSFFKQPTGPSASQRTLWMEHDSPRNTVSLIPATDRKTTQR